MALLNASDFTGFRDNLLFPVVYQTPFSLEM